MKKNKKIFISTYLTSILFYDFLWSHPDPDPTGFTTLYTIQDIFILSPRFWHHKRTLISRDFTSPLGEEYAA